MKKLNWKTVKKFLSDNKVGITQCAVMAGVMVLATDPTFATSTNEINNTSFSMVTGPLTKVRDLISGPIATGIGTLGAGIAGASWAFNIENQMTKAGMRVLGGTGIAIGAGDFLMATGAVCLL